MGEASGPYAKDYSGHCTPAAYNPGATHVPGAIVGDGDGAVGNPTPIGVVVDASSSGLPTGSTDRTIEMWEKTTTAGGQSFASYGSGAQQFTFRTNGVALQIYDGTGSPGNAGLPYSISDGTWHHIAATYSSGNTTMNVYLDGQLLAVNTSATVNTLAGPPLLIGTGTNAFTGSLDEFAIYSSVLSSARINARWLAGAGETCPPTPGSGYAGAVATDSPTRYFRLGESTGPFAKDYSGTCTAAAYNPAASHGAGAIVGDSDGSVGTPSPTAAVVVASSGGLPTGTTDRTVEAWVNTTTTGAQTIASYGGGGNQFNLSFNDTLLYVYDGNFYPVQATLPYVLSDGAWHQVAVTYSNSFTRMTAYVDGLPVGGSLSASVNTIGTGPLLLGVGTNNFTGSIDEFAIYPSELTAARIYTHYLASGNGPPFIGGALTADQARAGGYNYCLPCHGWVRTGSATHKPVNTQSGEFYHDFTDISIPGRGYPLQIARTYSSLGAATTGTFGYGWSTDLGMSLAVTGSAPNQVATISQENGTQASFNQPATGNIWAASAPRFIATLTYNPGSSTWTFVRKAADTYVFNSTGQLTTATDLNGYAAAYGYTSGKVTSITDQAGRSLTVNWTGANITSVTDSSVAGNTRTVAYSYDGSGNLQDVTDLNGGDTHFTYDTSHRMLTMKDPVCQALGVGCPGVQNHYDSNGRVDWQKDELNRQTTFAYAGNPQTAAGGSTTVTDPAGNVRYDYYEWGVRTFITLGYGTAAAATTHFMYDRSTLALTGQLDPNGNLTTFTVDSSGNVLTATDPLGQVTTKTYNALNEPLTIQDSKLVTTTNTYDSGGNLLTTSTPLSGSSCTCQVTTLHHTDLTHPGDVTSVDDPNGMTTSFHYDTYGNRDEVKDPLGNTSGTVSNADGWITASYSAKAGCTWGSSPPMGCSATYETVYSYTVAAVTNQFGDVRTITDPLSHVVTYTYDANRRTTVVNDGNGNNTTNAYDVAGQSCWTLPGGTSGNTCAIPPTNARVTDYNTDGTLADQKDGKGNAIMAYSYNSRDQVTSTTDALSNVTSYTRDLDGNVLTKQDPVASSTCTGTKVGCTTYTYDADNQIKTVSYSDSAAENITSIRYDADGQRTAMTDGTGSSSWVFDQLHRMTSYTNGNGAVVTYGYGSDLKNQVATIAYPNSVGTVTQAWSDDGTLHSVQDWNSKTTTFAYDANTNQTGQTVPSTANVTDTFAFNAANQMSSVSDSNGASLFSATYTRDSNGQLASDSSQAANQQNYKYTALNQLCYAGSAGSSACSSPPTSSYPYAFDNADNLTTNNGNAQQFNNADELCWNVTGTSANNCGTAPVGATAYGFDNKGNRTSMTPASGSATAYTYDQANRLTSYSGAGMQVASGASYFNSAALLPDGTVQSWGGNAHGQIGNGTTGGGSTNYSPQTTTITGAVSVASGREFAVAAKSDGTVWGWGLNNNKQLGDGTTTDRSSPVQASGLSGIRSVAASQNGAFAAALKNDGTVWTWGYGPDGQGNSASHAATEACAAGQTAPCSSYLSGIVQIAAGENVVYALKNDGTVWSFGLYYQGNTGDPTLTDNMLYPVQVAHLSGITQISAGQNDGMALKSDGTVWTWGDNSAGQLGNGTDCVSLCSTVDAAQIASFSGVSSVAGGYLLSAAVKSDGSVWEWGNNGIGQTGTGGTSAPNCGCITAPLQVLGTGGTGHIANVVSASLGNNHSVVVKAGGTVWTWGYNPDGELGNGTASSATSPVQASISGTHTTSATYTYNGDGMRQSKTVNGGPTTQFTWAGSNLLQQYDGSFTTSYIYGPGGTPIEQISGSTTTYLHHDQIGSTRLITDSAGAAGTATTLTYDPYGNAVAGSGSLSTALLFQGQYRDGESGLYYLRARYYDPTTAQFLSLDPMVSSTMSPYAYVAGNPLNAGDPTGLQMCPGDEGCPHGAPFPQGPIGPSSPFQPCTPRGEGPLGPVPGSVPTSLPSPPTPAPIDGPPGPLVGVSCVPEGPAGPSLHPTAGEYCLPAAPRVTDWSWVGVAGGYAFSCATTGAEAGGIAAAYGGEAPVVGWGWIAANAVGGCIVGLLENHGTGG